MFSFHSEFPLPLSNLGVYRGMAFDGCQYYLSSLCECTAAVLDRGLCPVKNINTRRPYSALCHDPRRRCFWALSSQCRFTLFRLDKDLREIDRLEPRVGGCAPEALSGLSFCCGSGRLLLSGESGIWEFDPDGAEARLLCRVKNCAMIPAIICLPPYIIFTLLRDSGAYFVLATRDGRILAEEKSAQAARISGMAPAPCTGDLLMLGNRHGCYPYLLRAKPDKDIAGCLLPCNFEHCRECEKESRCGSPSGCADILESIALVEASIAHILNAEGEKLQKAIARACSTEELLKVNSSVQRTILYVTQLEQVLVSKLEALQPVCCEKEDCCRCEKDEEKLYQ